MAQARTWDSNTVSPVDLIRRIEDGKGEFLLFALTHRVTRRSPNVCNRSLTRRSLAFARWISTA